MADKTSIEWTDATWNPVTGCTKVSQGCKNCYAERMWPKLEAAERRREHFEWQKVPPRPFTQVRCHPERLDAPLRWKRPRRIFVNSMSDLFHEDVPLEFIDLVFAVMALCPQHTFQVLTKRPERMANYIAGTIELEEWPSGEMRRHPRHWVIGSTMRGWSLQRIAATTNRSVRWLDDAHEAGVLLQEGVGWPIPNVWLGVSVEDQASADERIPLLLQTPATVRFISAEPLLGALDLSGWLSANALHEIDGGPRIDWVIVGGESGPGARPMHPDWVRSLRDQCAAEGVPFLFKQWGAWLPAGQDGNQDHEPRIINASDHPLHTTKKAAGRLLDGRVYDEYPS